MKTPPLKSFLLSVGCLPALLAGCSKSGSSTPYALDESKIPTAMSQSFSNAAADKQQAAATCVAALQSHDTVAAFSQLREISQQPDLTPEQRQVVAKTMVTTFLKLQAAAQTGDQAARAAVHQYTSTR